MERLFVVALLVSICSATSPPFFRVIPLDCNETEFETTVAMDLINEDRDDGFLLRPVRIESVYLQESVKIRGGFFYYLDIDVIETDCSVLSGKTWKECNHDIPFHEMVYGHCKAIAFIAKQWRIQKIWQYNCTIGSVPSSTIVRICPDCPVLVQNITPELKAKADHLIEQFNQASNQTHHFKVDDIERVRTQYVFGQSYFFLMTIKETECLKTQTNVNLADCKSLKDHEAHVGFCKGTTFNKPGGAEGLDVSCEIYNPIDDDDHKHKNCDHRRDSSKTEQGPEKSNADETKVKQEGNAEAGEGKDAPGKCEKGHCPHRRGHKHHRCRHDHHPHHHHPHHHHHHHDHLNDSHPHDPSHHPHPHPHPPPHHHHHHHNHTDGSSSEEHTDNKPHEKRSKGSVHFYYQSESKLPVPTIIPRPKPEHPGKHGNHDNIEFPSELSKLKTCPGGPMATLPTAIKDILFA